MKILKKILIIVIMLVLCVVLTACGKKENSKNESQDTLNYLASKKKTSNNVGSENKVDNGGTSEFMNSVKNISSDEALEKAKNQMKEPNSGDTIAIIHVKDFGDIKIKFFEDVAPKAVENFVTHSKEGYYNGVTFHRVIEEFMIQGGDPKGNGTGGESIWGKGFDEELSVDALPYRGALCMASSGTGTSSLGSQFFIVQANYKKEMESYLDRYGLENFKEAYKKYGGDLADLVGYGQYTTFGQVYEGMDVVDSIAKVQKDGNDKPLTDVIIESIEIKNY